MFHPLMQEMVRILDHGGAVCEFGNQRYGGRDGYKSVKDWYLANGYSEYVALDLNTQKNAQIADLNYPVDIGRQFDLVTNCGTTEHLFNQAQAFENAHDLCKVGGIMLHVLPLCPWINHGFFNYNPMMFYDLAATNDYQIRLSYIGNREGDVVELGEWGAEGKRAHKLLKAINALMDKKRGHVFNVFGLAKTRNAAFRYPHQNKYLSDIEDDEIRERYALGA